MMFAAKEGSGCCIQPHPMILSVIFFLSIFFLLPGLGSWVGAEKKEKPRKKRAGFHNLNEDATIFGSSIFLSKTKRWQSR